MLMWQVDYCHLFYSYLYARSPPVQLVQYVLLCTYKVFFKEKHAFIFLCLFYV